jgi:outer membrane protein OmpA-like peptidoglycan-associated protein
MDSIQVDAFQSGVTLLTAAGSLLIRVAPPGRMEKIWTGAAALIAALIFLFVKVKISDDASVNASSKEFWFGVALISLIVGIVSSVFYILSWQKRTAKHDGKSKVIGTELTPDGIKLRDKNPNISKDRLLFDAGGDASLAWTRDSLHRSHVILGVEYSLLVACLAFGLNVAAEVYRHDWKPKVNADTPPTLERLASELRDVHFDLNRSDIGGDAAEKLNEDADTLRKIFKQFPGARVTVEGYCDDQGSSDYNLRLGFKRADVVKQKLIGADVPADKMEVASLGKESFLCRDTDEPCRQKNRRVHLAVTE